LSESIGFVDMLVIFLVVLWSIVIFRGSSDAPQRTFAVYLEVLCSPMRSCAVFISTVLFDAVIHGTIDHST